MTLVSENKLNIVECNFIFSFASRMVFFAFDFFYNFDK